MLRFFERAAAVLRICADQNEHSSQPIQPDAPPFDVQDEEVADLRHHIVAIDGYYSVTSSVRGRFGGDLAVTLAIVGQQAGRGPGQANASQTVSRA